MKLLVSIAILLFSWHSYAGPEIDYEDQLKQADASAASLRTSLECIKIVGGNDDWKNSDNQAFYDWLQRHAPGVLSAQRTFSDQDELRDLEFIKGFFKPVDRDFDTRIVPFELWQSRSAEIQEDRVVLVVGAHPDEVQWLSDNTTDSSEIWVIDHSVETVNVLNKAAADRRWNKRKIKILHKSFLDEDLEEEITKNGGGEFPSFDIILMRYSAINEFNDREVPVVLQRSYNLLRDPGVFVVDMPSNPLTQEENRFIQVQIDLEKIPETTIPQSRRAHLREHDPPPPLNAYLFNLSNFRDYVESAGFTGIASISDPAAMSTNSFVYNDEKNPRALFLFDKQGTTPPRRSK